MFGNVCTHTVYLSSALNQIYTVQVVPTTGRDLAHYEFATSPAHLYHRLGYMMATP